MPKKYEYGESRKLFNAKKVKIRKCRECGKNLPPDRYFKHEKCVVKRDFEYEDTVYIL